jgi:hypothetical protein
MLHFQVAEDLDGHVQVSQVWISLFQVSQGLDESALLMRHFQVSEDLDGHVQVSQVWISLFQVSIG